MSYERSDLKRGRNLPFLSSKRERFAADRSVSQVMVGGDVSVDFAKCRFSSAFVVEPNPCVAPGSFEISVRS